MPGKKKPRKSSPALFDRLFGTGGGKKMSGGKSFTDQLIKTGKKAGGAMGRTGRPKKR